MRRPSIYFAAGLLIAGCAARAQPAAEPEATQVDAPGLAEAADAPVAEAAVEPVEAAPQDVASLAAGDGVVFVGSGHGCETWVFSSGGTELARVGDDSLTLRFTAEVGSGGVTLTKPRAGSGPHLVTPGCGDASEIDDGSPDQAGGEAAIYLEQAQCEAATDPTPLEGGCPATLLGVEQRASVVAELRALETKAREERRAQAQRDVRALKRRLAKTKTIHWLVRGKAGAVCESWKVRKSALVRTVNGSTLRYGYRVDFDERTGKAFVSLTGPESSGSSGSMAFGSYERRPLSEVDTQGASVGDERWFYNAAACEAALNPS